MIWRKNDLENKWMTLQHSNLFPVVDCIPYTTLFSWLLFSLFPLETRGSSAMRGRSRRESVCASAAGAALPAVCIDCPRCCCGEQSWPRRDDVGWGQLGRGLRRDLHTLTCAGTRITAAWAVSCAAARSDVQIPKLYLQLKSRKWHWCESTWR